VKVKYKIATRLNDEVRRMELFEIRNELDKTAKRLADFRGSL